MSHGPSPATGTSQTFRLSRVVNAPRDLVFTVWTSLEHLKKWFGPKGFTMPKATLDLRPGGVFHYQLLGPNGVEMWGKWIFSDIVRPEMFSYISGFSDERGDIGSHPMAPAWPKETLSVTTFTELHGKTTIVLESTAVNATPEGIEMFNASFASMTGGWSGTFDQLDAYLKEIKEA